MGKALQNSKQAKTGRPQFIEPRGTGISALALAGAVLTVAAFSTPNTQAVHDSSVLHIETLFPTAVEPLLIGLRSPTGQIVASDSLLKSEFSEQNRASGKKLTREVRQPVKEFLKRVVVPILVERYIASLNRESLVDRASEAD